MSYQWTSWMLDNCLRAELKFATARLTGLSLLWSWSNEIPTNHVQRIVPSCSHRPTTSGLHAEMNSGRVNAERHATNELSVDRNAAQEEKKKSNYHRIGMEMTMTKHPLSFIFMRIKFAIAKCQLVQVLFYFIHTLLLRSTVVASSL